MPDLAGARAQAESTLLDTCRITRAAATDPDAELDPDTWEPTGDAPEPTVIYEGSCSVTAGSETLRKLNGGEDVAGAHTVRVPISAVGIKPGDAVTVTDVGAMGDPDNVGKVIGVSFNETHGSYPVLRRLHGKTIEPGQTVVR